MRIKINFKEQSTIGYYKNMRVLLLTMNPVMDESEMASSLFKNAGFDCDIATSESEAFDLVQRNRYALIWVEDSADRDLGSNLEILLSSAAQKNQNISLIGHKLTKNKWLVETNRINRSYFEGDWANTLSRVYFQLKPFN